MKYSVLFPGQGSQSLGMLSELSKSHVVVQQTFEEASEALGLDLWHISQQGPVDKINSTEITQPLMLTAGISVWRIWQQLCAFQPAMLSGHSLGEYTALVAADALEFRDSVKLVSKRASLMQQAVSEGQGAMAAILGMSDEDVIAVCLQSANDEIVEAVNFNSPGQVVIAGDVAAVDRAIELATSKGAKRAIKLPVSVPSHCSLMENAAAELEQILAGITITEPTIAVIHNVDAKSHDSPDRIRKALKGQLYQPVRWSDSIEALRIAGIETAIEMGPGKVLTGLNRRIDRSLGAACIFDDKSLLKAVSLCEGKS